MANIVIGATEGTSGLGRVRRARAAAILTWIYTAAFGIAALPVSIYLAQRGALPTLADLFEM